MHKVGRGAKGDAPGTTTRGTSVAAWTVEKKARVAVARTDNERMLVVVYERGEYGGG